MGWRVYLNTGGLLPPATWVSSVLLVVTAALVFAAGLPVRRFLQGRRDKTLSPIRAARTLVLAQAAALTGAGVFGFYAAQVLLVVAGPRHPVLPHPALAAARAAAPARRSSRRRAWPPSGCAASTRGRR